MTSKKHLEIMERLGLLDWKDIQFWEEDDVDVASRPACDCGNPICQGEWSLNHREM
jgi:hypothetical protein